MKNYKKVFLFYVFFVYPLWVSAVSVPLGIAFEYGYGSSILPVYYHYNKRYIDVFSSVTKWDGYDTDILFEVKPFNEYTKISIYSYLSSSIDMRDENGILIGEYRCGINKIGYENGLNIGKLRGIASIGIEDRYVYLYHNYKVYGKLSLSFSFNNIVLGAILEGSADRKLDTYDVSVYVYKHLWNLWTVSGLLKRRDNQSNVIISLYKKNGRLPFGMDIGIMKDFCYLMPYFLYHFKRYDLLFSMIVNKYPYYVFSLEGNIGLIINF